MTSEQLIHEAIDTMEQGLKARTGMTLAAIREITRGQQKARAGLTRADAEAIRSLKNEGYVQSDLAYKFDVNPSTISRIVNGLLW